MKEVPLENYYLYRITKDKLASKYVQYPEYLVKMATDRGVPLGDTDLTDPNAIIASLMEWKKNQENCGSDIENDAFRKLRSQWRTKHRDGTKRPTEFKDSFRQDVPIPDGCVSANDVRALANAAVVVAIYGVEAPESEFEKSVASRLNEKMAIVLERLCESRDRNLVCSFASEFTKWFFGLVQMAITKKKQPMRLSVYSTFLKVRFGDTICIHACVLLYPYSLFFSNRPSPTMPSAAWTL